MVKIIVAILVQMVIVIKIKKEIPRIQLLIVIIYIGILMISLKLDANIVRWKQVVKPFLEIDLQN